MGCFSAMADIFSAATTSTLPWTDANRAASAMPNNEPALAMGRSIAGTPSSFNRLATLAAGPGNRRSDEPLETSSIPNSGAAIPAWARQSSAAAAAMSATVSPSAAKRRSSIPETLKIQSAELPTIAPISSFRTMRDGR